MKLRRSRLTDEQTERLLEHFVAGTPARPAADLAGVNRNTATLFYGRLREIIARRLAQVNPINDEIEADDIDLDPARAGERSSAAAGGVPLFGLVGRGDKVYSVLVSRTHRGASPHRRGKVQLDAIVYADALAPKTVLDVCDLRHEWANGSQAQARDPRQAESVRNFWNQAKRHLRRYNGVPRRNFHLFLKEYEWRFNYGSPDQLLHTLKLWINEQPKALR